MTHLGCTRNPMSSARRDHVHGPLIRLPERPEGELSIAAGTVIIALLLGAVALGIVAFG